MHITKSKLLLVLLIGLFHVFIFYYLFSSDEKGIRKVLNDIEMAVEKGDLDGVMDHIDLRYEDSLGLRYLNVREIMGHAFVRYKGFQIGIVNPKIEIRKKVAKVDFGLWAKISGGDLVASEDVPDPVTVELQKGFLKWKVIRVEGIHPNPALMSFAD